MLLKEFVLKMNGIRKGAFVKATWKSEKIVNGKTYEKVSNGVVRFVKYSNIKGVVCKNKNNDNDSALVVGKNGYLVQMATTNIKVKSTYMVNGVEISKSDYENIVGNNGVKGVVFRVKLENLISLGA